MAEALRAEVPAPFRRSCTMIHNAIDDRAISSANAGSSSPLEQPYVVCAGTLSPEKGSHHVVEAASILHDRLGRAAPLVLLLGDAKDESYRRHLEERVLAIGTDRVRIVPWTPDPFLFYRHAVAAVMAAVVEEVVHTPKGPVRAVGNEGLPRAVLEPLFLGVPVVATDVAGVREMVDDGVSGLVVPPGDPAALAHALEVVVGDPAAARRRAQRGREAAMRLFHPERMASAVEKLYAKLLDGGPG